MYRLSSIIILFLMFTTVFSQSPHGDELKIKCNQCHSPFGWEIDIHYMRFEHNETDFNLEGAHTQVDCKSCHTSMVFDKAPNQCASCHTDIHSMTVGNDCARCHTSNDWLIDNIPEIHEENGFPLIGVHGTLSCVDCHNSEPNLRFDNLGNECINCHQNDYLTAVPDHDNPQDPFPTDCIECHSPLGLGWDSDINHDFFPLTLGHDIPDCTQCHTNGNYSNLSSECVTCHQSDYDTTVDPPHDNAQFPTDCVECHTTNPGWTPATFPHDFFPLTLGHDIQDCTECHLTPNYSDTSPECITCHQTDYDTTTNPDHDSAGYPTDCIECHSTNPGWTPATANHDFFPLTLGHDIPDCTQCHTNGNYSNLSPECITCHQSDYDTTADPPHNDAQFPTDCVECHTINPNWTPVNWDHNEYYPLNGAHAIIANECVECHNGDYTNTPNTCVGCHLDDYNSTTDPNHRSAQFPQDCTECHTEIAWEPSTFDHDGMYFPIYSGKHDGEWSQCIECHTNPNDYGVFTCLQCHEHNNQSSLADDHSGVNDYTYVSSACLECHPDGSD